MTRVVFRALNRWEDADWDIHPRDPNAKLSFDSAMATSDPSQFVQTTSNIFAALYYAIMKSSFPEQVHSEAFFR